METMFKGMAFLCPSVINTCPFEAKTWVCGLSMIRLKGDGSFGRSFAAKNTINIPQRHPSETRIKQKKTKNLTIFKKPVKRFNFYHL
jgi:hypothetical protein